MKILYLLADANLRGGTEILTFNLVHALNANGQSATILSVAPYVGVDANVVSLGAKAHGLYRRLAAFPLNKLLGSVFSDAFLRRQISQLARERGVDWVVAQDYNLISALPRASTFRVGQVFNWSVRGYEQGIVGELTQRFSLKNLVSLWCFALHRFRWHKRMSTLDKLIVLSHAACGELRSICPQIRSEKLTVIPDPIMRNESATRLSSLDNKVVVFVGRLSQEKGVLRLLRIWARIHAALPEYTLAIYGTGHMKPQMDSYIADNGLSGVEFRGFCNDIEKIYLGADLLLMTSDSEGFGMVLVEAMYYGVPCVSFDCPISPKEIIAGGGVAIPCYDESAYAETVVSILQDGERHRAYQAVAARRASDFYQDKVVGLWKGVL